MKLIKEIARTELSQKVLKFCGNNTVYQVQEEITSQKKGKLGQGAYKIQQRNAIVIHGSCMCIAF